MNAAILATKRVMAICYHALAYTGAISITEPVTFTLECFPISFYSAIISHLRDKHYLLYEVFH